MDSYHIAILEKSILKQFQKKAKLTLAILKTSLQKGGYGGLDIAAQPRYRKAKIVQGLYTNSDNDYYRLLRYKLQLGVNHLIKKYIQKKKEKDCQKNTRKHNTGGE